MSVISNPPPGKIRSHDTAGLPILIDPQPYVPNTGELCQQVDTAADNARRAVVADPLRAVEYDRAAAQAQAFKDADYQGTVPPMVAAWAISGRTPQQAADSILAEAAQYNGALVQLRTTRLQAKELIRQAMANGNVEQAQDIAAETIAAIEAAVAGIGNNA
ncbi:phage tail protein [Pseudomonas aeruginosa]